MKWEESKQIIEENGGKLPEDWFILGIDLGTTNSIVSFFDDTSKKPESIDVSNGFGKIPLPSVVQYRDDDENIQGEWVIGDEAYRSMKIYPHTTIRSVKRKMGTDWKVELGKDSYSPEELSSKIIVELINHAKEVNPKCEIAGLVVSVPYDFDDAAKKATMKAVELAGLKDELICLIEEPKAAALSYNMRKELAKNEKILVFDFGGGTLDITLFHVVEKDDSHIKIQVISEGGEAYHGGDNIDDFILDLSYDFIEKRTGQKKEDIAIENQAELIARSREAKERLTGVKSFRIPFTFCIPPFVEQITRESFEELISDFSEKTRQLVLKTLREAYTGSVLPSQVDRVLLEGGSSQMPWVRDMLIEIFNEESKIYTSERPALDISIGATYYAAMKMGLLNSPDMETEKLNVEFQVTVPHDIGFEIENSGKKSFFTMIRRGTSYSLAKKSQVFTLNGETEEDMTTFSLKILERIDQTDTIEKCKIIGTVNISGLPKRPSGKTKLKITLLVEEDGGIVKGIIEDIGFMNEFMPSGFREEFMPNRFSTNVF